MSRLAHLFSRLRSSGEKAMGLFLTNGFPDPRSTLPILRTIDVHGADFIELGMPFSDPLGEGLPVQRSSERALRHGVKMVDVFRTVEAFRETSQTPLLLMGYVNPIYRYGVSAFCRDASSAGVDGLILPDLPPEESDLVEEDARKNGLDMVFLISPNTPSSRVEMIDRKATGFVYAVTVTGLTGSEIGGVSAVTDYLKRASRLVVQNPLLVGFGIKSHEDAVRLSEHTDGFIVGSALINEVESLWDDVSLEESQKLKQLAAFIHALKFGINEKIDLQQ